MDRHLDKRPPRLRDTLGRFVRCDKGCRVYCNHGVIRCPTCSRVLWPGEGCEVCRRCLGTAYADEILARVRSRP